MGEMPDANRETRYIISNKRGNTFAASLFLDTNIFSLDKKARFGKTASQSTVETRLTQLIMNKALTGAETTSITWRDLLGDASAVAPHLENFTEKVRNDEVAGINYDNLSQSYRIIEQLCSLVGDTNLLTPPEWLILTFSAVCVASPGVASKTNDSGLSIEHFDQLRGWVNSSSSRAFTGLGKQEAHLVGEVCRAVGMPSLDYLDQTLPTFVRGSDDVEIRVGTIAALLRLADGIDFVKNPSRRYHRWKQIVQTSTGLESSIASVKIDKSSWRIGIVAHVFKQAYELQLIGLKNQLTSELDIVSTELKRIGLHYRDVDLQISKTKVVETKKKRLNPFLRLAAFSASDTQLFAGRDHEIREIVQRVLSRPLVTLIGESGVGKSSLVAAGVLPQLKTYGYEILHFSFHGNIVENIAAAFLEAHNDRHSIALHKGKNTELERLEFHSSLRALVIDYLKIRGKPEKPIIMVGDHLEQLFTIGHKPNEERKFVEQLTELLSLKARLTFLFCIREDYLPQLYTLSNSIPELYDRKNTFRLHKMTFENAVRAFDRASKYAVHEMPSSVINDISRDLCDEGGGLAYPPFLQIVGDRLYSSISKAKNFSSGLFAKNYDRLGGMSSIVNRYFESLLDQFDHEEKLVVGQILELMVTEYYTKKRARIDDIRAVVLNAIDVEYVLTKLIRQRVVRAFPGGEYELIHDFLASKVIEFVKEKSFLSAPVRAAIDFIDKNYHRKELTCQMIAEASGVSHPHLAQLFKQQVGTSINRKLAMIRVASAKRHLSASRESLSSIAKQVGLPSQSALSKKFREIARTSPKEFRARQIALTTEKKRIAGGAVSLVDENISTVEPTMVKVFVSYSHDSDTHRERVLSLSERLRADGIETILDRYVEKGSPPEGWPRWMLNGLDKATHVLCICTEAYYRRFRGQELPEKGKGVDLEGSLMTQSIYNSRSVSNKFIPVLFARSDETHVPEILSAQTFYVLDSDAGYQALYDALLDQSGFMPGPVGVPKRKPRATGVPLTFG